MEDIAQDGRCERQVDARRLTTVITQSRRRQAGESVSQAAETEGGERRRWREGGREGGSEDGVRGREREKWRERKRRWNKYNQG